MRLRSMGAPTLVALIAWGAGTSAAQQVRDSSGVRLVRYEARDRPAAEWRVDSSPMFAVGGGEGEGGASFSNVAGVLRLRDGRVVVGGFVAADTGNM